MANNFKNKTLAKTILCGLLLVPGPCALRAQEQGLPKDGGYRAGTKRFTRYQDVLAAFAKNRDSKKPTVKHIAEGERK